MTFSSSQGLGHLESWQVASPHSGSCYSLLSSVLEPRVTLPTAQEVPEVPTLISRLICPFLAGDMSYHRNRYHRLCLCWLILRKANLVFSLCCIACVAVVCNHRGQSLGIFGPACISLPSPSNLRDFFPCSSRLASAAATPIGTLRVHAQLA